MKTEEPPVKIVLKNEGQPGKEEAVSQNLYMHLDSLSILPIEIASKFSESGTNVFPLERASRGYLARLDRSPVERVMDDLLKPRRERRGAPEGTPGWVFCTLKITRPGEMANGEEGSRKNTRAGFCSPKFTRPGELSDT